MINYIKTYVQTLIDRKKYSQSHLTELVIELRRFDPRDFEPSVRAELVNAIANFEAIGKERFSTKHVEPYLERLLPILDEFRGEGSRGVSRPFAFISNLQLKEIIIRDYAEIKVKLFPGGAWKSTVIMAGSVLEALLFDRLGGSKWHTLALASSKAPKLKGAVTAFDDWKLASLIDVSSEIGGLTKETAATVHQVIRDYRNFVHPKKEIRSSHQCTEAEAMLAVGALDAVCNYLEANP